MRFMTIAAIAATTVFAALPVHSSDQTFSFNHPSFGGSGLNSAYYLSLLESQKQFEEEEKTSLEQFSEDLERRILSTLASDVVEQIFGEDASADGSFTVGGLDVTYETVGGDVHITLTDGIGTTEIIVPEL